MKKEDVKKPNVHDGHRNRVRERIKSSGIDGFQNHEILEFLLYPFIPMKDTNEIAHDLIAHFGSFANVLNAESEEIESVKGVTKNASIFLSSLPSVFRTYEKSFFAEKRKLATQKEVKDFLRNYFVCRPKEAVYVLSLDPHNNLLGVFEVAEGWADSVNCGVRSVVDVALRSKATAVIMAHNHPSGIAVSSEADFMLTNAINCALELSGISLYDHLIFGGNDIYSFDDNGLFDSYNKNLNKMLNDGAKFFDKPVKEN